MFNTFNCLILEQAEETQFEIMYKNKFCLKVFLNYCMFLIYLPVSHANTALTLLKCTLVFLPVFDSFQAFLVQLITLLSVKTWVHFRIFIARSVSSWRNTENHRRNAKIQLHKSGFFPRLKRTTLSFFVQNNLCVC